MSSAWSREQRILGDRRWAALQGEPRPFNPKPKAPCREGLKPCRVKGHRRLRRRCLALVQP